MANFPPVPNQVKPIAHFLKVASEHEARNLVVTYWSRMYACQVAIKTIPEKKPPEVTALLIKIMDWLENCKKLNPDLEGIHDQTVAQALIEEYAIQLFLYADGQDRLKLYGKNIVKAFYTCGILMDVLQQFGTLSEDIVNKRKYAKWKAAYIHNCLKTGVEPLPGPPKQRNLLGESDDDEDDDEPVVDPAAVPPAIPPTSFTPVFPDQTNLPYIRKISEHKPPIGDTTDPDDDILNEPAPPANPVQPIYPSPQPVAPATIPTPSSIPSPSTPSTIEITDVDPEQVQKAQKYCKWAGSALQYDDITTAVENLQKALNLLQHGQE